MNRMAVKLFGQLKLAKFDEMHIIRDVTALYRKLKREAEEQYYEMCFEAYLLGLALCGIGGKKAHEMAEKAIDREWVVRLLADPDFVTGYAFTAETERKRDRLIEALAATAALMTSGGLKETGNISGGTNARINKAMRDWSKMFGQEGIGATDAAVTEAFEDAVVPKGQWIAQKDGRACEDCLRLDGQIFPLHLIPPKPHWGCRCRIRPVGTRG